METLKKIILLFATAGIISCEKDKSITEPHDEPDEITTVKMILSSDDGLDDVYIIHRDLDGEGGEDPEIILSSLFSNTTYDVQIYFLNEAIVPMDSINDRIIVEGEEYQVFVNFNPRLGISQSYTDADMHGNPVGIEMQLVTDSIGVANMNLQLRKGSDKNALGVSEGNITKAGGEIAKEINLQITIE